MPLRDETLTQELARAGICDDIAQTALAVDAILQVWRRRVVKRELGHRALADLGLSVDLAQLDVLMAVSAPVTEFGEGAEEETMVSTIAARLAIDPSRASRVTTDLIALGLLRRAASQADGRRSIVELTDGGARIVEAVRRYKLLVLGAHFKDWTPEERAAFLPLLARFSSWSDRADDPEGAIADQIDLLRAGLAD